eukprot:4803009-Prymnesium_polylepis.2
MPFGFPVDPDVYSTSSGCDASSGSGADSRQSLFTKCRGNGARSSAVGSESRVAVSPLAANLSGDVQPSEEDGAARIPKAAYSAASKTAVASCQPSGGATEESGRGTRTPIGRSMPWTCTA